MLSAFKIVPETMNNMGINIHYSCHTNVEKLASFPKYDLLNITLIHAIFVVLAQERMNV